MREASGTDSQQRTEVQESSSNESTFSPTKLYQMALPHIIQSNLRVQQLFSNEKKKQRVQDIVAALSILIFYRKFTLKKSRTSLLSVEFILVHVAILLTSVTMRLEIKSSKLVCSKGLKNQSKHVQTSLN